MRKEFEGIPNVDIIVRDTGAYVKPHIIFNLTSGLTEWAEEKKMVGRKQSDYVVYAINKISIRSFQLQREAKNQRNY